MTTATAVATARPRTGWLRNAPFDLAFIVGVAALAVASGWAVVVDPSLFPLILFLDIYLLGYHHVVSTFTRLAFDRESFLEHRFLVVWLPMIVLAVAVGAVLAVGGWMLSTTYLYWQWFHYTRQSYGIERVYRAKAGATAGGDVPGTSGVTKAALYLLPLWGILYRSYQAPESFLAVPVKTLPVPRPLLVVVAAVAIASVGVWIVQVVAGTLKHRRLAPHTLYLASHMVIFGTGYLLIDNLDHGWLVLNVWHNAQYILFVWLYNNNRYKNGVVPGQRFLSTISQSRNWPFYFLTCLLFSTVWYFGLDGALRTLQSRSALPLFLVAYQTINFHHYVVDGLIWKVRRKRLRANLGIGG
jgi:hypothetical protein